MGSLDYLDLLTVQETSKILHMCRQKVYQAISTGKIKAFKNDSGKYLIFKSSVAKYLEACYNQYSSNMICCSAQGGKENAE